MLLGKLHFYGKVTETVANSLRLLGVPFLMAARPTLGQRTAKAYQTIYLKGKMPSQN